MSVEINVLDTDPELAAEIANYIYKLVDKVKRRVAKGRAEIGLQIVEIEYRSLQSEIQVMEDKITKLRFKGVHDYESQSAVFNEQYAIALASGATPIILKKLRNAFRYFSKVWWKVRSIAR